MDVVAYNPQGNSLASATADGTVTVWDLGKRRTSADLDGQEPHGFPALAFSPDGALLAFGREDNAVSIWNVITSKELTSIIGHTGPVNSLAFSPEGWLASSSNDQTVRGWDTATGRQIHIIRGHTGYVFGLAFIPKSNACFQWGQHSSNLGPDAGPGIVSIEGSHRRGQCPGLQRERATVGQRWR